MYCSVGVYATSKIVFHIWGATLSSVALLSALVLTISYVLVRTGTLQRCTALSCSTAQHSSRTQLKWTQRVLTRTAVFCCRLRSTAGVLSVA